MAVLRFQSAIVPRHVENSCFITVPMKLCLVRRHAGIDSREIPRGLDRHRPIRDDIAQISRGTGPRATRPPPSPCSPATRAAMETGGIFTESVNQTGFGINQERAARHSREGFARTRKKKERKKTRAGGGIRGARTALRRALLNVRDKLRARARARSFDDKHNDDRGFIGERKSCNGNYSLLWRGPRHIAAHNMAPSIFLLFPRDFEAELRKKKKRRAHPEVDVPDKLPGFFRSIDTHPRTSDTFLIISSIRAAH